MWLIHPRFILCIGSATRESIVLGTNFRPLFARDAPISELCARPPATRRFPFCLDSRSVLNETFHQEILRINDVFGPFGPYFLEILLQEK